MGRFWAAVGRQVVAHPGLILAGQLPRARLSGVARDRRADHLRHAGRAQSEAESVQGMKLLEKHFLIGENWPDCGPGGYRPGGNFDTKAERKSISAITQQLQEFQYLDEPRRQDASVDHVRCLTNPLGDPLGVKLSMRQFIAPQRRRRQPGEQRQFLSSGEHQGEGHAAWGLVTDYDPFSQESIRLVGSLDQWLEEGRRRETGAPPGTTWIRCIPGHARSGYLDAVNRSDTKWVSVSTSRWPW